MAETGTGLALSGGGFRAALFNLGSLWRLNELGMLSSVKRITSVSGGSITNAVLALHWPELHFSGGIADNFSTVVAQPLMRFCLKGIDISAGLSGLFSPRSGIGGQLEARYRQGLFGAATLQDLPDESRNPAFVFYATSLQTGASVRMSRKYLADYKLGMLDLPALPLARVVAASSGFPPWLSPVYIDTDPCQWRITQGALRSGDPALRRRMVLTDGGVYDNMGLESVWRRYDTVLVSDAGKPFAINPTPSSSWPRQLLRVLDICTEQQRALRKRQLLGELHNGVRKGAYWGIASAIGNYGLADPMSQDSARSRQLAGIRTRLNRFSEEEQGMLVNWGYALADAALRRHLARGSKAGAWPFPQFAL